MKTDDLIDLLATDASPVSPHAAERRFAWALGVGLLLALWWVLASFGLRPDLAEVAATPAFALKMGVPLLVLAAGLVAVFRLAHPGARVRGWSAGLWLPVLLWGISAVVALAQAADAGERAALVWGSTWRVCSFNVLTTALPVGVGLLWALKGLAPTRPTLAGATAGWVAGAAGAAVYALHCPEMEAPFLAVWYVLGMAAAAALGAAAGRIWLRW